MYYYFLLGTTSTVRLYSIPIELFILNAFLYYIIQVYNNNNIRALHIISVNYGLMGNLPIVSTT